MTRTLLSQQRTLAANKLQCNIQIKRSSTPDPPSMSNVPPRWARTRSEKANGVTSGSSEESDCEPQTASKVWFEALKRQFETPTKSEEETPSYSAPVKRQRLFFVHIPPKVPQTVHPWVVLLDPPEDPMAQPLKVTQWDYHARRPAALYILYIDF